MFALVTTLAATADEGDSGGSFLVSPNVGLMIWTLLVFGISMWLLAKLAFPRIAEALDKRQRAIEDSIDSAERTRREADQLLSEYRERLAEARSQADEIVTRARRTGEATEAEIVAEARARRPPPRGRGPHRDGRREGHAQDARRGRSASARRGGAQRTRLLRNLLRLRFRPVRPDKGLS